MVVPLHLWLKDEGGADILGSRGFRTGRKH